MLKKVFLAASLSLVLAGATMTVAPTEVLAGKTGCFKKAKAKYGLHLIKRHGLSQSLPAGSHVA